ncbi:hypothetical protein [Bacillus smithii]|uniref:hypothetical protein n=1 Tax=Bacillus smithii TaxID=1479 RepID=UPI00077BC6CD|nr:hypothetical protein [Bacillus smithii]
MVSKKSKRNVHIIPNEQFAELKNIERVTTYVYKRKKIKDELMERITDALGRKLRKAKKTILVIDEIIWKATDRGFSFNGYETLIKKFGVSTSTISRAIGLLKESGEVVVCYRENPKSNGPKTPVVIFRNHANFDKIASILGLNEKVDEKVEKAEKPTATRDEALKTFATIIGLPYKNKTKSYIKGKIQPYEKIVEYLAYKIDQVQRRNGKGIEHLSSYIDEVFENEIRKATLFIKHKQQKQKLTIKPSPRAVFYDWLNEKPKPKSADLDALGVY